MATPEVLAKAGINLHHVNSTSAPVDASLAMAAHLPLICACSYTLFAMAALVGGCAILVYGYVTSLACGYAPGAASYHAAPWNLGSDDRFWLVGMPACIVASLIVLALQPVARRSPDKRA